MPPLLGADVGNATFATEVFQKGMDLVAGEGRQNFLKFEDGPATVVLEVSQEEFLVGLAVQTARASVGALFSREVVKALREDVAGSSSTAEKLYDPGLAERMKA